VVGKKEEEETASEREKLHTFSVAANKKREFPIH
jgi:hypothetical protein